MLQGPLGHQELLDLRGHKGLRDLQDLQGCREIQVQQAYREAQDPQVPQVRWVLPELLDRQEPQELMEPLELQAGRGLQVYPVIMESQVLRVQREV